MLAIAAAVLFLLALIMQVLGLGLGPVSAAVLVTAGLLCLALDLAGMGRRRVL